MLRAHLEIGMAHMSLTRELYVYVVFRSIRWYTRLHFADVVSMNLRSLEVSRCECNDCYGREVFSGYDDSLSTDMRNPKGSLGEF